jgi:hypothetical protein
VIVVRTAIGGVSSANGDLRRLRPGPGLLALTDFLRSNNIEVLNTAGPRELKERGVYEWTLTISRSLNRAASVGIP